MAAVGVTELPEPGGEWPVGGAEVAFGGERRAFVGREDSGQDRGLSGRGRQDLLGPFVEEVPADRDPEEDQEQGAEEPGIVTTRGSQGTSPLR